MKNSKMILNILAASMTALALAGCGSVNPDNKEADSVAAAEVSIQSDAKTRQLNESEQDTAQEDNAKRVAKDGADMQTEDPLMPTRKLPENGTRINMHFGDTVIPGVLNDSETAKALIDMLPVTVHMNRYSHDFCGSASELNLPYQEDEVHYGWLNGDIDYAIDAPWYTILFEDEDVSEQYGSQVNIGVIDCPLSDISSLDGSYDVLIEIAE